MSATLPGLAARYQRATSTVFRSTEHPWACMLTVLMERERTPCMFAITSEARQGGSCGGARGCGRGLRRRAGGSHRLVAEVVWEVRQRRVAALDAERADGLDEFGREL